MALDISAQLANLAIARRLVLGDPQHYPTVVTSLLPVIGPAAHVELRRWGADFLAETFASPLVPSGTKETMAVTVISMLRELLENERQDYAVVKSVCQIAASIYPAMVRWIINNPYDTLSWDQMTSLKLRIFKLWDTSVPGVRICCIKFVQKMVMVQTPGLPSEDPGFVPGDLSSNMIPAAHAILKPKNLEAEASGLLDRMLSVFQEHKNDVLLIDATLNTLASLLRLRPMFTNKVIPILLNFDPFELATEPMSPKTRVVVKSLEKTVRMLLVHIIKRYPQHPFTTRLHRYVSHNMRRVTEIFDEITRKRGPPEPTDGLDPVKRQKLHAQLPIRVHVPPLQPGTHTVAELFTVTTDEALKAFDVGQLPEGLVVKIGITLLQRIDADVLEQTIKGVRERYDSLKTTIPEELNPKTAILGVDNDDDDDYEPDFYPAEDTDQILNKLDAAPPEPPPLLGPEVALGRFVLPPPPALIPSQTVDCGQKAIARVFSAVRQIEDVGARKTKAGLNRLAASSYDREAWITIFTRLATRSAVALEGDHAVKQDPEISSRPSLSDSIRESLHLYILEDFRRRIDLAVAWLCEEWYNDRVASKELDTSQPHYSTWVLRVLDGMMPYLDAKDKVLTRFLAEIPHLDAAIFERVKALCRDPAMVGLALTSLLYLVMMRPPVRDLALDTVEDIWREYDDARPLAGKYLTKWRPSFLERMAAEAAASKMETDSEAPSEQHIAKEEFAVA